MKPDQIPPLVAQPIIEENKPEKERKSFPEQTLEEKLPKKLEELVFSKYVELIETSQNIASELRKRFGSEKHHDKDTENAIRDNLLRRAKNLLEKYTDNPTKNVGNIMHELDTINADNMLLLSIFKSLHTTTGIKFEDFKEFTFYNSFSQAQFLSNSEIDQMATIIEKNYKDAPEKIRKVIKESFIDSVQHSVYEPIDVDVPELLYKGKVVAFCRLDYEKYKYIGSKDYGKKVYFGSFNVDPDFVNGEIGTAMLERTIDNVAVNNIVEADCNAFSKIGAKYIESGFNVVDFYDFHGWPSLKIIRDDSKKASIIGKNLSEEEIVSLSEIGSIEKNGKIAQIVSVSKQEDLSPIFQNAKADNKIISRYFYENKIKKWFVVIEPDVSLQE